LDHWGAATRPAALHSNPFHRRTALMNNIIYIVGLVVIVLLILSFLGLR
jgi:hypothetical protein